MQLTFRGQTYHAPETPMLEKTNISTGKYRGLLYPVFTHHIPARRPNQLTYRGQSYQA